MEIGNKYYYYYYMQLKLYKTHQPDELCPMPPLEMRCSVSIPEAGVLIML